MSGPSSIVIAVDGKPLELERLPWGFHYNSAGDPDFIYVILPSGERYRQDIAYQDVQKPISFSAWYLWV
jgi:hypothetical protein